MRVYLDRKDAGMWYIIHNPAGNGLALCIERGIPCENHTQILSYHTTNTPSLDDVKIVVEKKRVQIVEQINSFVEFMRSLGSQRDLKEHIGLVFANNLLSRIVMDASLYELERAGKCVVVRGNYEQFLDSINSEVVSD